MTKSPKRVKFGDGSQQLAQPHVKRPVSNSQDDVRPLDGGQHNRVLPCLLHTSAGSDPNFQRFDFQLVFLP